MLASLMVMPTAAYWHGWRDQHVRISPQLSQKVIQQARRNLQDNKTFSDELKAAAVKAVKNAERFHWERMRKGTEETVKDGNNRRKTLDVQYGTGRDITVTAQNNGAASATHADMSRARTGSGIENAPLAAPRPSRGAG